MSASLETFDVGAPLSARMRAETIHFHDDRDDDHNSNRSEDVLAGAALSAIMVGFVFSAMLWTRLVVLVVG